MDFGIRGKWAVVCGASKGLGYGCAEALAGEGVNLVINARTGAALEEAATPLPASAVVSEGHIVPQQYTTLSFLAPGVVQEVKVSQGDEVKKGDVLMRLDNAGQAEAQVVAASEVGHGEQPGSPSARPIQPADSLRVLVHEPQFAGEEP